MEQGKTGRKGSPAVMVALLLLGGFITIFNEVEMNIALPTVSQVYDVPVATAQWLTTGYMLVAGALMPLAAFMMGRFGSRACAIGSLLVLLAGNLVSLFSNSFELLLAGRLIQAVCAAFFMPVMMAVIMSVAPKEKLGMYNGLAMLVLMAAPAISPTVSGLVLSTLGFSWLFTLMIPLLLVVLAGMVFFMDDVLEKRAAQVDPVSVVLSCLGFGGVVFGIGRAASCGFASPEVLVSIAVGVAALVVYVRRQLASDHPLLNLRILAVKRYRRSVELMAVMQVVLFGTILVVPLFLQVGWGLSAMEAGLYMLPGGVLTALGNLAAGMAYDRLGIKIVPFGLMGTAVGFLGTASAMWFGLDPIVLIVSCAVYSGSLPFALTALNTNSLGSLEMSQLPDGSSMNNTSNQIFGSLGTALFTIVVYQLCGDLVSGAAIAMVVAVAAVAATLMCFLAFFRSLDASGARR